jgi:hypothetical protein
MKSQRARTAQLETTILTILAYSMIVVFMALIMSTGEKSLEVRVAWAPVIRARESSGTVFRRSDCRQG